MKRQIICIKDAREHLLHKYDGEWSKRIYGVAKRDFVCDLCGEPINTGDNCCAESMGLGDEIPVTAWEKEYIEVIK